MSDEHEEKAPETLDSPSHEPKEPAAAVAELDPDAPKAHEAHAAERGDVRPSFTNPIYAAARTMHGWAVGKLLTKAEYETGLAEAAAVGLFGSAADAKALTAAAANRQHAEPLVSK